LLAEGVRRAILTTASARQETVDAPGLVLLDGANRVDAVTPAARHWLGELLFDEELPSVVHAMANHARRVGRPDTPGPLQPAQARARTRSGRWLVLHGSLVDGDPDGRVAVILEPARPPQIAPLVAMAYGLSPRERDIARLVLQGLSTSEIATELFLSPHTVQDYLKAIFDKVGVRSRREMVTRVFTEHYAPAWPTRSPSARTDGSCAESTCSRHPADPHQHGAQGDRRLDLGRKGRDQAEPVALGDHGRHQGSRAGPCSPGRCGWPSGAMGGFGRL
jgi:DNA-binding CsgD family transcriptional regulator